MTRSKAYQESLIAALSDPLEATDYLNVALEDGDKELFLLALRNVRRGAPGRHKSTRYGNRPEPREFVTEVVRQG